MSAAAIVETSAPYRVNLFPLDEPSLGASPALMRAYISKIKTGLAKGLIEDPRDVRAFVRKCHQFVTTLGWCINFP